MTTSLKISYIRQALRVSIAVLLTACSFSLIGCGGGNGSSAGGTGSANTGRTAAFSLDWKNVAPAVKSVKVDIINAGVVTSTKTQDRPTANGVSSLAFANLPTGSLNAVTTEFDASGGAGNSLGAVEASLGTTSEANISLQAGGAISKVDAIASVSIVPPGQSKQLALVLKDASGNRLLIPSGQIQWSTSDSAIATIDQSGKVTGISNGSVQIVAKDSVSRNLVGFVIVVSASTKLNSPSDFVGTWKLKTITFNGNTTTCPGGVLSATGFIGSVTCPETVLQIKADGTFDSRTKDQGELSRIVGGWNLNAIFPLNETKTGSDDNHDGVVSDSELTPVIDDSSTTSSSVNSAPDDGQFSASSHFQFAVIDNQFVIQLTYVQNQNGNVTSYASTRVYQRQ